MIPKMPPTVDQALAVALRTRWSHSKDQERTHSKARRIGDHLPPKGGVAGLDRQVDSITPSDIAHASRQLELDGLGPASVNRHLAALRGALRAAHEEGWCGPPPAARTRREGPGRERAPTAEEVEAVVANLPKAHGRLVQFLWRTGCRLGEALEIHPRDVRLEGRLGRGGMDCFATFRDTKSGKDRTIPIPNGTPLPPFTGVTRTGFHRRWILARDFAGIGDWFVPHSLRHGRITALLAAGVPITTVAAYVGHSTVRTTERYSHPGGGDLQRCAAIP